MRQQLVRPPLAALVLGVLASTASLAQDQGPMRGTTIWARAGGGSASELAGSAFGAPQLALGARGGSTTIGIGLGLSRLSSSDDDRFPNGDRSQSEDRALLWQIGPEIIKDVWQSAGGRTRANLSGGVAYGRLSVTEKFTDTFGGSTTTSETKSRGSIVTVRAGMGGEHWLDRHFALGFEAGLRFSSAFDVKEEGTTSSFGFGMAGTYAALRAQLVLGR